MQRCVSFFILSSLCMAKRLLILILLVAALKGRSQEFKQISDSLLYYYQLQDYEKALPYAEKATELIKTNYGVENKLYSSFLSIQSVILIGNASFQKAEQSLLVLKEINAKIFGTGNEEYIKVLNLLAVVYNRIGQDEKTIPLLIESAAFHKKSFGDSSYEYGSALNRLAKVYEDIGNNEQALPVAEQAVSIIEVSKGKQSLEYATGLTNLAIIKKNMGKPEEAEPALLTTLEIRKKLAGEFSNDVANSLNNLAVLYSDLEQYQKSADYYLKAAAIYEKLKGKSSFEYLTTLSNLASACDYLEQFDKALAFLNEALDLAKKNYDEDWPLLQNIKRNLGELYISMENYDKALPLLEESLAYEEKKNDKSNAYAMALNNLALLQHSIANDSVAERLYKKSLQVTKTIMGNRHRDYAATLGNLASLYQQEKKFNQAIGLRKEAIEIEKNWMINLFAVLSESEKLNYIQRLEFNQYSNLSLLFQFPEASASYYIDCFNQQLFLQSLLLTESKNRLLAIRENKDSLLQAVFTKWNNGKILLAKQYALPEENRNQNLSKWEAETEANEKELIRLSSRFRDLKNAFNIKMQDVQQRLNINEAWVSFVRFHTVKNKEADSIVYAAFILKKEDSVPLFIPLFEEQSLLRQVNYLGKTSKVVVNMMYPDKTSNSYSTTAPNHLLYQMLWAPLEPALKGINTVYYSPAGKLYNIAFEALAVDSTLLLSDKYEMQQLTGVGYFVNKTLQNNQNPTDKIVLFGNPDFSLDSAALIYYYQENSLKTKKPEIINSTGSWPQLPGTGEEIDSISKIFSSYKKLVTSFTGVQASEKNLKLLNNQSPSSIFIGTHGFFLPAPQSNRQFAGNVYARDANPLLRSGLILSGGNYAWSGKKPIDGIEDGVVTAYEISQLNLSNTKLVVLSACETGLGDVNATEGVFGLQRAFKLAGVNKLIVSLWKVPDKETAELMKIFYTQLLAGNSIEKAFATAKAKMRKKYSPYYWAAFVLVE